MSDRAKIDVRQFPPFGYRGTSHTQLTPDERPNLTDGIISTAWNAGTLHVQYVGLEKVAKPAVDTVSEAMWRFATECQLMVVLYAGVLLSRATIQSQIGSERNRDTPFAISTTGKDGKVSGIWAWLPTGTVFDAFSAGGEHRALGELETAGIQLDGQVHRTEDCLPNGSWHQQYVKMATRFLDQSWFTGNRVEASWKLTSVN